MQSAGSPAWTAGAIAILVAMTLFATSCVSTSREMKYWVGKPETELLTSWGPPDASQQLDDGRVVHTWRTIWGKRDNVRTCLQTFTVSAKKKIEGTSYRGCPRLQSVPIW